MKYKKQAILLILFLAVIVLIRFTPIADYVTLEKVKEHRDALSTFAATHQVTSVFLFIMLYIVTIALSIPIAAVLTLMGGFLFGVVQATVYVNIGATIGATLAFLTARYLLGNYVQGKYERQLTRFNEEIQRNGTRYILTVRFIPVFPFFLVNFLSGLTRIPLKTFIWTTSVGTIPATVVFAYAGQQIGSINSVRDILSTNMLIAFLLLALITIIPAVLNALKQKRARQQ